MLEFYLLRHGQTIFNLDEHVQGFNDSPLTDTGIFQARCTGYGLKDTGFNKAYSGLCGRQIMTGQVFFLENHKPLDIVPDIHFNEMNYGKYQAGTYFDMLNPLYQDLSLPYDNYEGLLKIYDHIEIAQLLADKDETGETEGPHESASRFLEGLKMLCEENKNGKILIATSSLVIGMTAYEICPSLDMHKLVDNASISIISYDGSFHLQDYDNISYRQAGERHFGGDA